VWRVLKYEVNYYKYHLLTLALFIVMYTIFSLFDFQLTNSPDWEIDYWGGIISLILYTYLIIVWGTRIKEKRIRLHNLLPISQKHNAYLRLSISSLPFIFLIIYLILIHLIIIENWHAETGSVIGQVGIVLIYFAGFIRGRDDRFSHWSFGKRFRAAFITVFIIQIVLVFIFTEKPGINVGLIDRYGMEAFHYANLVFPLLGFIILVTSLYSYKKRKVYLN